MDVIENVLSFVVLDGKDAWGPDADDFPGAEEVVADSVETAIVLPQKVEEDDDEYWSRKAAVVVSDGEEHDGEDDPDSEDNDGESRRLAPFKRVKLDTCTDFFYFIVVVKLV